MALNAPLLALAVGAFGIGVTEFTPMGMLPLIAGDLNVSIPAAGLVVSAYALGVLIGAPVMTLATARMGRRRLLVGLMAIFTLGNLMAAVADSYAMLIAARLVTASEPRRLLRGRRGGGGRDRAAGTPRRRGGRHVLGPHRRVRSGACRSPPGSARRSAGARRSGGSRGSAPSTMLALRLALPELEAEAGSDMRAELRVLGRGPVLAALALTTVGFSAMFTVFTYIVPILRDETGRATPFVTAMLVVNGIGLALGNWLGGRLADRSVDGTILAALAAHVGILVLFACARCATRRR